MKRFPPRTLLLMVLALAAFARLWCITHPAGGRAEPRAIRVDVLANPDAG